MKKKTLYIESTFIVGFRVCGMQIDSERKRLGLGG